VDNKHSIEMFPYLGINLYRYNGDEVIELVFIIAGLFASLYFFCPVPWEYISNIDLTPGGN